MQQERFEAFTRMISDVNKDIQRIKSEQIERFGLKGVHVLWLYQLFRFPDGLSASELARKSGTDRSLISREIETLFQKGFVAASENTGKRRYNQKISLTEEGRKVAKEITRIVTGIQQQLDVGISEEELRTFYRVLGLLQERLAGLACDSDEKKTEVADGC